MKTKSSSRGTLMVRLFPQEELNESGIKYSKKKRREIGELLWRSINPPHFKMLQASKRAQIVYHLGSSSWL